MDSKEKKSIKSELKDVESMLRSTSDMNEQMVDMCCEIASVGSTFEDLTDADRDYIVRQIDKFEYASRVQEDMSKLIFKHYSPLGYWHNSLDSISMSEFRTYYRNISKKYDEYTNIYFDFYGMYNELARRRYVPSKPKLKKV